ncbi:cyclophilin-like fold protein [Emticicia sp. SJ17W-69]|uniref:cyclophilin-like fold protein n=1 Tax=Emticicia sp. SJ17W-69 TaxID=3421657 RepID=UPI003EB90091
MKQTFISLPIVFAIILCLAFCGKNNANLDDIKIERNMITNINIKIGEKSFKATLSNNSTTFEFTKLLPLTLKMNELNANEKYAQLPKSLLTNASVPASIQSGDLMLYGSNTLVLFYKSFSTSYSYTKIGKIDDATGLASALGTGNVTISFESIDK